MSFPLKGQSCQCLPQMMITVDFEVETDKAVVARCPISFELATSRALQNEGLSRSKNKHEPIAVSEAFDDSRMWKRVGLPTLADGN